MRPWKGFSILELLITLIGLSVLATIGIPAFFHRPGVTLENASILLAHDLRSAQNRSAYMAESCEVRFLANGDGYRITDAEGHIVENPATGRPFKRNYSDDAVFQGVRITLADCAGDATMLYDETGRALEDALIVIRFRGEERRVVVAKGKGLVTIEGSTSGWTDSGY